MKKTLFYLENGLKICHIHNRNSSSVSICLGYGVGSRDENQDEHGLSHFIEHMMFKSTKNFPGVAEISQAIDQVGGDIGAFTTKEMVCFTVQVFIKDWKTAIDVISDIAIHPLFRDEDICKEKTVVLEELSKVRDLPMDRISEEIEALIYKYQPFSLPILGTKSSVNSFSKNTIKKYYQEKFVADNATLVISGNISLKVIKKYVVDKFKQMNRGKVNLRKPIEYSQTFPEIFFQHYDADHVYCASAVRAYPMNHPFYIPCKLIAIVLGGNMSSRLFKKIREHKGYAYRVNAYSDTYSDLGYLSVFTSVNQSHICPTLDIILNEFRNIGDDIKPEEISAAKSFLIGKKKISLESNDNVSFDMLRRISYNKISQTPEDHYKAIKNTTINEVKIACRQIFQNDRLNVLILGNLSQSQLKEVKSRLYINY